MSSFGANTGSGTANGVAVLNGTVVHPTNGTWTLNTYGGYSASGAMKNTPVTGGSLDLTDGTAADSGPGYKAARTAFYNTPLPVNTSFNVTYTYTPSNHGRDCLPLPTGQTHDNGMAFVLQNSVYGRRKR